MFPLLLSKLIATLVIGYLFIAIFFTIKIFLLPLHKISCTSAKIASKLASLLSVCIIFANVKVSKGQSLTKSLKSLKTLRQIKTLRPVGTIRSIKINNL